ncbi:MAG: GGDEF domain-containing protein [Oscillospiraceae bacterium]|nr:GGDEF domain-containing protein [Oscillospiraceae bacterium]
MLNQTEYLHALEKFLHDMEQLEIKSAEDVGNAAADLCHILHIGRITMEYLYDIGMPEAETNVEFYRAEKFYNGNSIGIKMMPQSGPEILYQAFPEEENSFTEEIKEKAELLLHTMSALNSRVKLMQVMTRLLYHDDDVDIPNVRYFSMYIGKLLRAGADLSVYTAVFLNLKHFSVINQQIGRKLGTLVMKRYVHEIKAVLPEPDEFICRIGGDNFAVFLRHEHLPQVIQIIEGIGVSYNNFSDRVLVTATAGIYQIQKEDKIQNPSDILDRSNLACYTARAPGSQDIVKFHHKMLDIKKKNVEIENLFPSAIQNEEFLVYYQPKISLDGFRIAGAEALCRWMHNGKLIPPIDFIPVLERGMAVCTLDFYMLEHVCRDIRRWLDEGRHVVRISVNLSRLHMTDMDLLKHILEIIDRNHVPHEYIEIELTETTTDVEFKDIKRVVHGLQEAGISTSVDDFGIGYSSLNLIKEIPWNVLKIDKSFLPDESDADKRTKKAMFRHVVAMAQEIGLECIAEGVETKEQVDLLLSNCCNLAQGFLFDKPLPVADFEKRLSDYQYHYPE